MIQRATVMAMLARSCLATGVSVMAFNVAQAQPVRGLYVSGAGGASFNQTQTVNPKTRVFPKGRDEFDPGITGLGSVGWGLDNGFRVELEGNYRQNRYSGFHSPGLSSKASGHQQKYGIMANALFDMDIGQNWIYPYFGAGIGYGWQSMDTKLRSTTSAGSYSQHVTDTTGNFAYQAMIGASLPVPWVVGLSTTMEYRFYTILAPHKHHAYGTASLASAGVDGSYYGKRNTRTDFNHSLMLGLRYEFNPAPPPPAPISTPSAAPAPSPARSYLVFFDWDSAMLSSRAREVVAVAARNSTSAQLTHIEVNGHTDNSGQKTTKGRTYNQALSLRRANAIKSELIRDGVAAGLISVQGFGSTKPLVHTAPNAKEAQNRRVEIIFH
ncbi:OmpA family protein [Aristophania vespae]|uniref:OmpA family protein n=1 Tax=Aristophania vespae TaxID=2697033 RepID=UPI002351853D|nr:OmpA family protein [Aristophania vespae]UMM64366.1 Outer membrane protein [Aristophania vespae]